MKLGKYTLTTFIFLAVLILIVLHSNQALARLVTTSHNNDSHLQKLVNTFQKKTQIFSEKESKKPNLLIPIHTLSGPEKEQYIDRIIFSSDSDIHSVFFLALMNEKTNVCIPKKANWIKADRVMEVNPVIYNPYIFFGEIVANLPEDDGQIKSISGSNLGIFIKYDKVDDIWGFWMIYYDVSQNKIQKVFLSSSDDLLFPNANSYHFILSHKTC